MRFSSGVTDQYLYFVAVDSTDFTTRETGFSSFTVYRSRDGAAAAAMTTPTINETDSGNMAGVYELLLDEDMTIGAGNDTEEMAFHITHAGMAPVTRTIELYRPKITAGYTLGVESDGDLTKANTLDGHTAQTGDNYARIGAPAGASVSADIAEIEGQTDDIGVAGAGLTAIPTIATVTDVTNQVTADVTAISGDSNAADNLELDYDGTGYAKANSTIGTTTTNTDMLTAAAVNAEVDTALTDYDGPTNAEMEARTILTASYFDPAADTVATVTDVTNQITAAANADAVWDEAKAGHVAGGSFGEEVQAHALTTDVDAVPTAVENRTEMDSNSTQLTAIVADTNELQTDDVPGLIAALNDVSTAEVNTQVDTALSDIHLDHLLAVDYDPASKPGVATALLNELVEDDGGVSRYTENALEQAPSGTGASAATIADAVWNELATGHTDAGKAGEQLWTDVDAILADTNELQTDDVPSLISALNDLSSANVATELATYDGPTKAEMDSGFAALNDPTAAGVADAVLDEALAGHVAAGSLGKAVADIETDATAILADTNELQADWTNGGRLDLIIDAILADTNELQGDWTNGGRLDLIIDAILADTNELQTDDIPTLIAALNDLSAADVNAEVDTGFTTQMADSVPADGTIPTREQAIYMIIQWLSERSTAGTTVTVNKVNGSTALMTFTLDDATTPTSITRAT